MPFLPALTPALLSAIIGAGTAATTTGLELSGALKPDAPKPQPQVTPAIQNAQKDAIGSQFPSLQSQVGGSVSPEYYSQIAQLLSGNANTPGANASAGNALAQYYTGTGGPSTGLTSSTGTQSGGLTTSSPTPGSGQNDIVSSGLADLFKQFNLGGTNAPSV